MGSDARPIAAGEWHPAGSSRSVAALLMEANGRIEARDKESGAALATLALEDAAFSARVGSIPRRLTFADGSLFESWDNDGIDRFLADSGRGGGGIVHALERFHPRLVVLTAAAILLAGAVYRYALPVLVEVAVLATPPVVPQIMSESALTTLDQTVLDETALPKDRQAEIKQGFSRIATVSEHGDAAYELNFRAGGVIGPNAFALPDGTLILTDELVELAGGDTEMILGVLAHEIGHVELEHSLRQLYRAAGIAALVMLIAGDVGSGVEDMLTQGGGLLALSYSRAAESEADRRSVELMRKAGLNPTAIARFFARLQKELGDRSGTNILSTHPGTPERRKAILDYDTLLRQKAGD